MSTPATTAMGEGWAPNHISAFDPQDKLEDALIVRAAERAGTVEGDAPSVLVPYIKTDPAAGFFDEGAEIDQKPIEGSQIAITTRKVAVVSRYSRELAVQPGAAERIADSLRRAVTAKADAAFCGNATEPTGLFEITGIANAGALENDIFAVHDAIAAIEADGGTATTVLVNPLDWATLAKLPDESGSNRGLLDSQVEAGKSLAGLPVISHSAVPQGEALVYDATEVVAAYGDLLVARSDDAYFASDSVAVRATFRVGWEVVRPERLQKLTVGAA